MPRHDHDAMGSCYRVSSLTFGILSPEQVRKMSVVDVSETALYDRNIPRTHAINDMRLGTVDRRFCCHTCKQDVMSCIGHFGKIDLAYPVYHIGYMDIALKILRSVCFFCSRILVEETSNKVGILYKNYHDKKVHSTSEHKQFLTTVSNMCKSKKKCVHCSCSQPSYMKMSVNIRADFEVMDEKDRANVPFPQQFTAIDALSIIRNIPGSDLQILGFKSPSMVRHIIIEKGLAVPPPIMRPTIMVSDGSRIRGQDDLTIRLQDIVKQNRILLNHTAYRPWSRTVPPSLVKQYDILQHLVAVYVNHDVKSSTSYNKSGRASGPCRSLFYRLRGKRGRVRGNLMGKRCDFSSRTVITPDPYIDIELIGVPEFIALRQTIPETVNMYNIQRLQACVCKGYGVIGGCKSLSIKGKGTYQLDMVHKDITVRCGDIVNRYIADGDWIMFNRQPSLHKQSIMGHRVKIMKGLTFRLPVCCTTPYNADFDGDEMNMHVCQSSEAMCEISEIMNVNSQIISSQSNKPIIGLVQDVLIGSYLMTRKDVFVNRMDFVSISSGIVHKRNFGVVPAPTIEHPTPLWTGKQLFSETLPDITLNKRGRYACADDGPESVHERVVCIRRGNILSGILCKQTLGGVSGGVIHIIFKDKGSAHAGHFIGDAQRVVHKWLENYGFSIGLGDCTTTDTTQREVKDIIGKCIGELKWHKVPDEKVSSAKLQSVLDQTGGVVIQNIDPENAIYQAVMSGSKGNPINISQIMACVGQQSVEGKRINIGSAYQSRGLSCYDPMDVSPTKHGFVTGSYMGGLNAQEYFFHAMGGREGLVDTAVKTAATGYISRRLIKVMESVHVAHDRSIRSALGEIVQFTYGSDNINPIYTEKVSMPDLHRRQEDIERFFLVEGRVGAYSRRRIRTLAADGREEFKAFAAILADMKLGVENGEEEHTLYTPINVHRLLMYHADPSARYPAFYQPSEVVNHLCNKIAHLGGGNPFATASIRLIIRRAMNTRSIIFQHRIDEASLVACARRIVDEYKRAFIQPGEMVGPLAASSIGEPCTQMTLNTFHYAGVSSKNVTLGVPRFKELIDCSKNIKTPSLRVHLNDTLAQHKGTSNEIARTLQMVQMEDILGHKPFVGRHRELRRCFPEDDSLLRMYERIDVFHPFDPDEWNLRCVLSLDKMEGSFLSCTSVAERVQADLGAGFRVVMSPTNMIHRVMIVRVIVPRDDKNERTEEAKREWDEKVRAELDYIANYRIKGVIVNGVKNIERCICSKSDGRWVIDTDGSNMIDVMMYPGIDATRTISNDVNEVVGVLGIEAGIRVLYDEIKHVLSFDGTYVNDKHIMLLVDTMSFNGFMCPVSRHGMAKSNMGPLMRASFEETVDVLLDAAIYNDTDNIDGVTENIMLGNLSPIGTGFSGIDTSDVMCRMGGSGTATPQPGRSFVFKRNKTDASVTNIKRKFVGRRLDERTDGQRKYYIRNQRDRVIEHGEAGKRALLDDSLQSGTKKRKISDGSETFVPLTPRIFRVESGASAVKE